MTLKGNFWRGGGFNLKNLPWEGYGYFLEQQTGKVVAFNNLHTYHAGVINPPAPPYHYTLYTQFADELAYRYGMPMIISYPTYQLIQCNIWLVLHTLLLLLYHCRMKMLTEKPPQSVCCRMCADQTAEQVTKISALKHFNLGRLSGVDFSSWITDHCRLTCTLTKKVKP